MTQLHPGNKVAKKRRLSKSKAAARSQKVRKKVTVVREHPRHVPVSPKNPDGITIVDQHPRRLPGTFLDREEIKSIAEKYDRKNLVYPASDKLKNFDDADKYDDLNKVRQKDLKDPEVAIPMGVRWIFRKKAMAASKLGRVPTAEEIILEYKGLLRSKTDLKNRALANFRKNYAKLKSK